MSAEAVIGVVALALSTLGSAAGAAYLWVQKRRQEAALFELKALVGKAKAEGEVDSVRVKSDQKQADWIIAKYRVTIDSYEARFDVFERRIAEGTEREIRAREELAGTKADLANLKADNGRLREEVKVLHQRIEQLERGQC